MVKYNNMRCTTCDNSYRRKAVSIEEEVGKCIECIGKEVNLLDKTSTLYKYIKELEEDYWSNKEHWSSLEDDSDYDSDKDDEDLEEVEVKDD